MDLLIHSLLAAIVFGAFTGIYLLFTTSVKKAISKSHTRVLNDYKYFEKKILGDRYSISTTSFQTEQSVKGITCFISDNMVLDFSIKNWELDLSVSLEENLKNNFKSAILSGETDYKLIQNSELNEIEVNGIKTKYIHVNCDDNLVFTSVFYYCKNEWVVLHFYTRYFNKVEPIILKIINSFRVF